jgi:hypothetical protein
MTKDKNAEQTTKNAEKLRPIYCATCGNVVVRVPPDELPNPRILYCPRGHVTGLPNGVILDGTTKIIIYGRSRA